MEIRKPGLTARPGRPLLVAALYMLVAVATTHPLWLHLAGDPLADVRAYYDAGARLNAGRPLYPAGQDVNGPTAYFYPPLFAILFRPLALLPYEAAAAIWEAIVVAAFVATLWLLGIRRRATWIAVGILSVPIAWTLVVAQAQSVVTLLPVPFDLLHRRIISRLLRRRWNLVIAQRNGRRLGHIADGG